MTKKLINTIILLLVLAFSVSSALANDLDDIIYANISPKKIDGNLSVCNFPSALDTSVPEGTNLHINISAGKNRRLSSYRIEIDGRIFAEKTYSSGSYYRWVTFCWVPLAGKHTVTFTIRDVNNKTYTATRTVEVTASSKSSSASASTQKSNSGNSNYTFNGASFRVVSGYKSEYCYSQKNYNRFINSRGQNVGCTATAMASAASIYRGIAISPNDVKWSSNGTSWELMTKLLVNGRRYDGNTFNQSEALSAIVSSLLNDRPVVLYVRGLSMDHVVTAIGYKNNGSSLSDILIIDPLDGNLKLLSSYSGIDTTGGLRVPIK